MKHLTLTSMLSLGLFLVGYGQKLSKEERIEARFQQEWLMTRDPLTKNVPRDRLFDAIRTARERRQSSDLRSGVVPIFWFERGPSNVGGRTRGLLIDANDVNGKRVWAGSVSGGLWRTNDIDASPVVWVNIDDYFSNLAVTTIAQSPTNPNLMLFGTGEEGTYTLGDVAGGVRGMGIWRSTNGGTSWQQLPITGVNYNAINKIVFDNTGVAYAATSRGLFRATDANGNFNTAAPAVLAGNVQDIEIASDGTPFATVNGQGVWRFRNGTWAQLADSDFPATDIGRIEIATAPSDANTLYAAYSAAAIDSCVRVFVSTDAGTSWAPRTCPSIGKICWYAFTMTVDPLNTNRLWIGSVDLYHSSDGASTWVKANIGHVDQHVLVYRPGNSNEFIVGNDGGVYRSLNAADAAPTLTAKNNGYNVTQFYSVAMHPFAKSNFMLGGTQDNGTQRFTCPGVCATDSPTGADGGYCFVDQDNPKIQITSQQERAFILTTDSFATSINLLPSKKSALFIAPADYDDANNILYVSDGVDSLARVSNVGTSNTPTFERIPQLNKGQISAIRVSPNTAHRLFVGTTGGRILRIDNANQAGATTVTVLDSIFSSYISSIEVEAGDDKHLLVTTSAYGRVSIYETKDGGTTWIAVEGDLPDMPVRWAMFHPFDSTQALIATELGVWSTDHLDGAKTEWFPTNTFGLANVRVDMLQYRSSDHMVTAATHGRGMYTTDYFNLLKTACPPDLNLTGISPAGLFLARDFITSDATVMVGKSVIYHAGSFIQLKPGFRAEPGSFFLAAIQPCVMNAMEPPTIRLTERKYDDKPTLSLFPNPVSYRMNIRVDLPKTAWYNLQVRTMDGRLVSSLTPGNRTGIGEQWHELDATTLSGGIYFLMLQTANGAIVERFIVVQE